MQSIANRTEVLLNENIIDVRYYWNVLMMNKWWILVLALIASSVAAFVATKLDPVYRSTATVLIENAENRVVSIEGVYGMDTRAKEYYLTQFEILKSRELIERLVARMNLTTHPEFDPRQQASFDWRNVVPGWLDGVKKMFPKEEQPITDELIRSVVVAKVNDAMILEPVTNTQLVRISFESSDPALAAKIANEMADVYIESNMEARLQMTQKAAAWLTSRLGSLSAKLKESEAKLQEYRDKETLVDFSGVNSLNEKELNALTLRYVSASNARTQAQNVLDQVRAAGTTSVERLLELPSILSHELVRSLKTSQSEADLRVAEMSKRYGPRHPKLMAAKAEADQARDELYRQVQRVARGIESDYRAALDNEKALSIQLDSVKQSAQNINRKEFRLSELKREVETNRQLYDMFMTRAKETDETGGLQTAHARIIDPAQAPLEPVAPKRSLIVLLALIASLGLGVLVAFIRDALDNTIKTSEEVEHKLRTRTLGLLPKIKSRGRHMPAEGFLSDNFSSFAEAIRSLRTGIVLSNIDQPYKTIMVTSSVPNEGKSTVALNLAEALGQMERVLLIEADLRKPVMAAALGVPPDAPGLTSVVAGTHELKTCIHSIPKLGIDVLVAGILPGNPQELLSSRRVFMTLEILKRHYDRIIIDTPPMTPVSDAMVLSSFADGVIYVVKAGETPASLATRGIKQLSDVRAALLGVVLNQAGSANKEQYGTYYTAETPASEPRVVVSQSQRNTTTDLS